MARPKFDVGFNYEEARAKLMSASGGYPQAATLPEVRPAILFNPSTRFTLAVPKVAPKATQEPGEQLDEAGVREARPIPKVEASSLRYARPTPKRKSVASSPQPGQSSEPAVPPDLQTSTVRVEPGARGRLHDVSAGLEPAGGEDSTSLVGSPEPASLKVCTPLEDSPEPANPQFCASLVGSLEPAGLEGSPPSIGSPEPAVLKDPVGLGTRSEDTGQVDALPLHPDVRTIDIGLNRAGSASGGHEAAEMVGAGSERSESMKAQKANRLSPSEPGMLEPVSTSTGAASAPSMSCGSDGTQGGPRRLGSSLLGSASENAPQPGSSTAGVQEKEVRSAHEGAISRRTPSASNLARVEQNPARLQEYSAVIEINRTVRVTHAPGKVEQFKVHGSRRVLEVLLLTWRSGVQLKELSRHIQGAEGSAVSMDASLRVPIGRLIVGSVLTVKYEWDRGGHLAEINASLLQTLLESSQGSETNCQRCDPLRVARIFVQRSGENVPMLMNLRMQLRPYPIGATCEEVLTELQLQSHTLVGLCRAFTHWVPIPKQFRMQPSWCTLIWPVPRAE